MATFMEMLQARFDEGKFLCIGLDPDVDKFPQSLRSGAISGRTIRFNQEVVDATKDLVCAYKPNAAFYERYRGAGDQALLYTIRHIRRVAPGVPIILDYKRGDIGNTNGGYIETVLTPSRYGITDLDVDAVTVNPYMGGESLQPFLELSDKGVIVLCRTSNPGAGEFQDLQVEFTGPECDLWRMPLYQYVARQVAQSWNGRGNCCVVVGATAPDELAKVRSLVGDMPILIPGIGAQGGDLEKTVAAGKNSRGQGMIINSSRGIIYASDGANFAEAARAAAQQTHDDIIAALAA